MSEQLPPAPPTAAPGPSGRAITALIFGILSLIPCCLFVAGIPAMVLGYTELSSINNGRAPKSGETLARIGALLGLIGTAFGALIVFVWATIIFAGYITEGL